MISGVEVVSFVLGVLLVWLVMWDLFQTIVLPRPSPGWFRIGRWLIRPAWRVFRTIGVGRNGKRHDQLLGFFAPAATILLLAVWLGLLMLGYGLILFALRDEVSPSPTNLGQAVYFAASSILTLGYGDIVATEPLARFVVVVSAATGLGVVALAVTYLFSLYGSYQRREVAVVTLQSLAGAPPSAVTLLVNCRLLGLEGRLPDLFLEWQRWAAEVLDTHVAYPLLGYFRSSHDNLTWIGALGSMLDAASLILTTVEGLPRGEVELFRRVGSHLVEDISNLGFRASPHVHAADSAGASSLDGTDKEELDKAAFLTACDRLAEAGYRLAPRREAWHAFQAIREPYAERLEGMAVFWAARSTSWLGTSETPRSAVHR